MQDLVAWLRANPVAAGALISAFAALVGSVMGGIVAIVTARLTHHYTARREATKANSDAIHARRATLRGHLERIVKCVLAHVEAENRLSKSMVMQMTISAASGQPPDPKAVVKPDADVQPLDEAVALASMYFPSLRSPLIGVRQASGAFVAFRAEEVEAWRKDQKAWLIALTDPVEAEKKVQRGNAALARLAAAAEQVVAQAKALIDSDDLLPGKPPPKG